MQECCTAAAKRLIGDSKSEDFERTSASNARVSPSRARATRVSSPNVSLGGPGLALATLGAAANVPVALIFCFDTLLLFTLVPFLMTLSDPQRKAADASKAAYQKALSAKGLGPITTEIAPSGEFYFAEDYHQQYLAKNPAGYCGLGGTGVSCPIGAGVNAA